ncbi:hypothetical protein KUV50_13665 [Membranicola marinus]|uniref:Uncharacterized protein n=1 Tax=Membranihabitans marinus TaxID=1227546 RepID=A0A953HVG4_9BACT|nr:hypothetical protein [Membranihabitans marinus]MBY5959195.1 hypothetical protein [Membranihabitans marinus]
MLSRRKFILKATKHSVAFLALGNVSTLMFIKSGIQVKRGLKTSVLVEEDIYSYVNANNGAGPLWASGCTSIVRMGDQLFASGLETDPEVEGLSNCQWLLFERKKSGWMLVARDLVNYTREPCPLGAFGGDQVLLSVNPKMADTCTKYCPTRPGVLTFNSKAPYGIHEQWIPEWGNNPGFNDHSYRAWGVDSGNQEVILFQNYLYDHAEWTFRDRHGAWLATGGLLWPRKSYHGKEIPLRLCYSNVVLRDRKAWFLSTADIVEPVEAWREYKLESTGQKWDYVFRRLYFSWNSDVVQRDFSSWILIADRDATAGHIRNQDLWVDEDNTAYLLWTEKAIDERLRPTFFPDAKQYKALNCSVVKNGELLTTIAVAAHKEDEEGDLTPGNGRFVVTPEGRLMVVFYISGITADGRKVSENRMVEILRTPMVPRGESIQIPFDAPFVTFQVPSQGAGCSPSRFIDLLGVRENKKNTISYAQVKLT